MRVNRGDAQTGSTRDSHESPREEHSMPMTTRLPFITLNNGVELPALGLGVFQSPPAETVTAVEAAIAAGYRLIDTAAAYFNERDVGEGIRRSGIPRDEVFIETKVWISDYGYDATLHAFDKSVRKIGVDQLDLLLLHQPLPSAFERTLDAYRALEKLLAAGSVRAIGVSNFMPQHLERLLNETSVVPAVNQIEVHPYFQQSALQRLHAEHGIATQAWSPIGGITSYRDMEKRSFDDPTLLEIARQHGKSPAQVMLRWHLQEGRSAIPKSVKPARIAENFDVFDFELTREQVATIDALETGVRGGPEPESITLETYGRPIPEA
jgi:diketogulonate reductase-like aldo/keto reductase